MQEVTPELILKTTDYATNLYRKLSQLRVQYEKEDWIQEALLLLCEVADIFDSSLFSGKDFWHYYVIQLKWKCHNQKYKCTRDQKLYEKECNYLQNILLYLPEHEDLICTIIQIEDICKDSALTLIEQSTINRLIQGYRQIDIAQEDHVSSCAVYCRIQNIQRKLYKKYKEV